MAAGAATAAVAAGTGWVWVLVLLMMWCGSSYGAVYKVGDQAGWTIIGNVDYKSWAATKTFQIGDVILFEYNPQFHNVMRVTHKAWKSCNVSSPIELHTTGNDSIKITNHGHHFYLCGVPGHCQMGQKVDIHILSTPSHSTAPSPSVSSSLAKPALMAPGPSTSNTPPLNPLKGISIGFVVAIYIVLFQNLLVYR